MAVGWHRSTRILIDQKAIQANVANELAHLPENYQLFAVVKANGYGHGAIDVAGAAKMGGANGFCVALLDEAIELRNAGFTDPILVLGAIEIGDLPLIQEYDLSISVHSLDFLYEMLDYQKRIDRKAKAIKIHLAIDTGMGRIGLIDLNEILSAAELIQANDLAWVGIYTHYATADEADYTYFDQQQKRFNAILAQLPLLPPIIHARNSAASLWHNKNNGFENTIRLGIAMYGLNPSNGLLPVPYPLKPALRLETSLVHVKKVKANSKISYGATYTAENDEWIGTLPLGYADGWRRSMQGGRVLVDGEYCEIVGRVCMDQCMIRLPHYYPVGTKVVLIGDSGQNTITVDDIAKKMETINYEVLCGLSERIPRLLIEHNHLQASNIADEEGLS